MALLESFHEILLLLLHYEKFMKQGIIGFFLRKHGNIEAVCRGILNLFPSVRNQGLIEPVGGEDTFERLLVMKRSAAQH